MNEVADVTETSSDRWRRRAIKTMSYVVVAAVVYALLVLAARALHRRVLYQPPESSGELPVPDGVTLLTATASDGTPVFALEFPSAKATKTIVHFHGNAETADDSTTLAREKTSMLWQYRKYPFCEPEAVLVMPARLATPP
jgi:hypothetical protein